MALLTDVPAPLRTVVEKARAAPVPAVKPTPGTTAPPPLAELTPRVGR
jgi:hypothetical protein